MKLYIYISTKNSVTLAPFLEERKKKYIKSSAKGTSLYITVL